MRNWKVGLGVLFTVTVVGATSISIAAAERNAEPSLDFGPGVTKLADILERDVAVVSEAVHQVRRELRIEAIQKKLNRLSEANELTEEEADKILIAAIDKLDQRKGLPLTARRNVEGNNHHLRTHEIESTKLKAWTKHGSRLGNENTKKLETAAKQGLDQNQGKNHWAKRIKGNRSISPKDINQKLRRAVEEGVITLEEAKNKATGLREKLAHSVKEYYSTKGQNDLKDLVDKVNAAVY